jgi:DNA-binding MarR family transcriptional regulator
VLERRRGEDRRTNGLWLTPSGKRLLSRVKKHIQAHEAHIGGRLSAEERAQLIALLRKLLA